MNVMCDCHRPGCPRCDSDGTITRHHESMFKNMNDTTNKTKNDFVSYVAGFAFTKDRERITLVRKNRPEAQRDRWNAIGGKIESGEHPADAMRREFEEETGVAIDGWENYCTIGNESYAVYFFRAFDDKSLMLKSTTDEYVFSCPLRNLPNELMDNIAWLIPMALDPNVSFSEVKLNPNI